MLYVLIGIAVILYGVYLFKKIKTLKQEKNKNNCVETSDTTKVEIDKK